MPIRSKAQLAFFAIHHPDLLHKWQKEAPVNLAKLPQHVKGGKKAVKLAGQ
jgi:hypothetical protein